MAQSSPSGPGTTIQLTLTGQGADPSTMTPTTPSNPTPTPSTPAQSDSSTTIPDTGFFTSESSSVAPLFLGGIICFVVIFALVFAFLRREKRRFAFAKSFNYQKSKSAFKNFGIFAGFLILSMLSLGTILPNFLSESDSASAFSTNNAISITTGSFQTNNIIPMSVAISETGSMAVGGEEITVTSSTTSGYTLYLSTGTGTENRLYLDGQSSAGYISPASSTTTSPTSLGLNQWGFATNIDTTTAYQNPAKWAAVPTYGNEVILKQSTAATEANDKTNIVYGAYVNNTIPAGTYSNTVLYTAIANV